MDLFDVLTLIGGLCLFLFGMNVMGQALEKRAGNKLRGLLGTLTTSKPAGFLTGMGVTAVIQSSSATTVMVVGFVNSGLITLSQAINVIMGANVGTTITSWVLSLSGVSGDSIFIQLLKPSSFSPILALVGIILYMFVKNNKRKDEGLILLGFATLMFGMETMSGAVAGLSSVPEFRDLFIMFQNPIMGMLVGAVVTAIIQSSSASVGILQALAITGQISIGATIPIIMGQNIGTCITALLSSVGTNKNAKRASFVHLAFNLIGTLVWLSVYSVVKYAVEPAILNEAASALTIAICHTAFNILCVVLLLPMSNILERLAYKVIPESKTPERFSELDERLLNTPSIALETSRRMVIDMAKVSVASIDEAFKVLNSYDKELASSIREKEDLTDHYEDILGNYLVKLSAKQITSSDSREAAKLLKIINDFERISDHSVNLLESAEELHEKGIEFTEYAKRDFSIISSAITEILTYASQSFINRDVSMANLVEPLEEVVDTLKENFRLGHVERMQQGMCSVEAGFIWSDILTNLERVSDHCSNIAESVIDKRSLSVHKELRMRIERPEFKENFEKFSAKYLQ